MKKVIVFGGSGFLGSHVADKLTEHGYDVSIFDIVESPYFNAKKQKMILGDILDKKAVFSACESMNYIFNFAGLADINHAKDAPDLTIQLNIVGNHNILEAAKLYKAERFIFASSVYAHSEIGSFYSVSKHTSERFVELYYERYKLPFTILRYGSLYGRRADKRNTIYNFVRSALESNLIEYIGTGEELREYIHVEDAAKASIDILSPEFENSHIVLTGNQAFKVREIMSMIAEILHTNVELKFDKLVIDSHYKITPYSHRLRLGKKFTVNPFVDIGQGILDCIHELEETKFHDQF